MRSQPPGPYKWILHLKDHYSKFSQLYYLEIKEAGPIADCLLEFIKYYGQSETLQSDNGKEFLGAVLHYLQANGYKNCTRKTPYTPNPGSYRARQPSY